MDVGGMAVEAEPYNFFFAMWQMAAEWQFDKTASDMEVRMKQRSVIEFLHAQKKWHLLTFISASWALMES